MCPSALRSLLLSTVILSFAPAASALPPEVERQSDCALSGCLESDPSTRPIEAPPPSWLELGLSPALELGRGVVGASVLSTSLTLRTWNGLRLGLSYTPTLGIIDGMEGCSTATVCHNERWRAGARAEYQFGTRGLRPWLALELGRETWSGTDMTTAGFPEVSGTRTIWSGQAGLDGVIGDSDGSLGIGLFATYALQHDGSGPGVGARLAIGFF